MIPEQVPDALVARALEARDQAANVVYGDEKQMRHVLAAVLSEARTAERIEYACRWTDWGGNVVTRRADEQVTKYDMCGLGEQGLADARRIVESTRLWQPGYGLPVDAVVVSRPVSEWAVLPIEEG